MRLAIIGSRDYPDLDRVARFIDKLPPGTVVVSGGARGVDAYAAGCARRRRLPVEVIRADWKALGRRAGMERNEVLVASVDRVVAFWNHVSRGTAHAIRVAHRAKKPVRVCGLHGEIPEAEALDRARRILDANRPKPPKEPVRPEDVEYRHESRTRMLRRWSRARRPQAR